MAELNLVAVPHNQRILDAVTQLTDVTRPMITHHGHLRLTREARHLTRLKRLRALKGVKLSD